METKVYLDINPYGFRYNLKHPAIKSYYFRYKKWKGLPPNMPISDAARKDFETYLDRIFSKPPRN